MTSLIIKHKNKIIVSAVFSIILYNNIYKIPPYHIGHIYIFNKLSRYNLYPGDYGIQIPFITKIMIFPRIIRKELNFTNAITKDYVKIKIKSNIKYCTINDTYNILKYYGNNYFDNIIKVKVDEIINDIIVSYEYDEIINDIIVSYENEDIIDKNKIIEINNLINKNIKEYFKIRGLILNIVIVIKQDFRKK